MKVRAGLLLKLFYVYYYYNAVTLHRILGVHLCTRKIIFFNETVKILSI